MEDILDTFLVRVEGSQNPNDKESLRKRLGEKMTKLFKKSKERHKISGAIEKIRKNLQDVTERRGRYTVEDIVAKPAASSQTVDPRLDAMYRVASQIIGIEKSSADLISMLLPKEESNKKLKIVSVVGVGGLGKTTLAKAVFDGLKSNFGYGAFVPVGQDPDFKKVFRDILIDLDKKEYADPKYTILDERQLINELHDFLRAKRYFIVVDDIWEPRSLARIRLAFVENNCACRIIITTRKFEVATEADGVYKLGSLSDDNSKRLFYMRLFGGEGKCPKNHPDELSKAVLTKCGGIPLAIITMSSLLLGKSREQWYEVCNSPGFYRDTKSDWHLENTMHILSLSYYDLPSHLKTCLLYLSVYPEDFFIDKDLLIWKWIAEGFVEKKQGRGLFEVGEEYFHDLINRSMIQGVDSDGYGLMHGCLVHDMVLDLIVSMSRQENFVNVGGTLAQTHTRRLAIQNREVDLTQDTHVDLPQVRTFMVWGCDIIQLALHPRLKLIRVLALEKCKFRDTCHSFKHIGNLLHLRYLGIPARPFLNDLPKEKVALKFLQTLNLNDAYGELPYSIAMLTQLECLRAPLMWPSCGLIGRLTSLTDLEIRHPNKNDEVRIQFVKDLGNLSELRVLKISYWIEMDESIETTLIESLCKLQKLQHLTLPHTSRFCNMNSWNAAVLSRDLRRFFWRSFDFVSLPSWVNSAHVPCLSHIEICVSLVDVEGFNALGGLPELCYLGLDIYSPAETITCSNTVESDGWFQKLRSLALFNSMVQFVANEDSSVSFTIFSHRDVATGWRRKKDNECTQVPAVVMMPNLEVLEFSVNVKQFMENGFSCEDIGLGYLLSVRRVVVYLRCWDAYEDDVEREVAALRHAVQVHPNRPTLEIEYYGKDKIKRRDLTTAAEGTGDASSSR